MERSEPKTWSAEEIDLIQQYVMPEGSTESDLRHLLDFAERTGLDPLMRHIYAARRKGKITVEATIDGLRLAAERTGQYLGQKPTEWCGADESWHEVWTSEEPPIAARVGVMRRGFTDPQYATARYQDYVQHTREGNVTEIWQKMASHMLGKVAEALSLRKTFPGALSGLYTSEEMDHLDVSPGLPQMVPDLQAPTPVEPKAAPVASTATPSQNPPAEPRQATSASTPASGAPKPTATAPTASKAAGSTKTPEAPKAAEAIKSAKRLSDTAAARLWKQAKAQGLSTEALLTHANRVLKTDYKALRDMSDEEAKTVASSLDQLKKDAAAAPQETTSFSDTRAAADVILSHIREIATEVGAIEDVSAIIHDVFGTAPETLMPGQAIQMYAAAQIAPKSSREEFGAFLRDKNNIEAMV